MPDGRIDDWVFFYDAQYVSGGIMGLRWIVNTRWTLWRLVQMTCRGLTELPEQSRNAAHTSAITPRVETNGLSQMDYGRSGIAAREGLRPEMDEIRQIPSGDISLPDMDLDCIWMDDWRWTTGGGWQEMDVRRWITGDGWQSISLPIMKILGLCELILFAKWLTLISSYEVTIERRYTDTRYAAGDMVPATTWASCNAEYDPNFASVTPSHTVRMPIPHIMKPNKINPWRSNDPYRGGWQCWNRNNPYCE